MPNKTPDRTPHEQALIDLLAQSMSRNRWNAQMTHDSLAEKSGISLRSIQAMQAGQMNIRFTTLARIMKALGHKSWDELLPHWDDVDVKKLTEKKAVKKKGKGVPRKYVKGKVKKVAKKVVKKAVKKAATKATKKVARKALKKAAKKATKKPPRKSKSGSKKK